MICVREGEPHEHKCIRCLKPLDCETYFGGDHACPDCHAWFERLDEIGRSIPAGTFGEAP